MSTPGGASDTPRSSEKKRVRFKQEAEVREYESLDNPKKARLVIVPPDAIDALEGWIKYLNFKIYLLTAPKITYTVIN
jgi:hypothetical protein